MAADRRLILVGARVVAGVAGTAVVAAVVSAALWGERPVWETSPVSVAVTPVPTDVERVCAGPLLSVGDDPTAATAVNALGDPSITSAVANGGSEPKSRALEEPDLAGGSGSAIVLSTSAESGATAPPLLAGAQSQTIADETHAGLAVAACTEATPESWLVGGSTDIGRTSVIQLSNPTAVTATVDLEVYGENGRVDAPGASGLLVQPGTQRIIPLAGLAPDLLSPVVHVVSHGGQVAAALQTSIIRGLEPGGVDIIDPLPAASKSLVIPGVAVRAASAAGVGEGSGEVPYGDDQPGLRLVVPGDTGTVATVSIVGENGAPGTSFTVDLEPGTVIEAPLDLPAGTYSVRVDADQPIVAGARTAVADPSGRDVAWFAPATPLGTQSALVAIPDAPSPVLHLWNGADADASVTLTSSAGDTSTLSVPTGQAVAVPLAAGGDYTIEGASGVAASVDFSAAGALAAFTVSPGSELAAPLTVYTH
jgi:hypothetical protein